MGKLNGWEYYIGDELQKDYFQNLQAFLNEEYESRVIYPKREDIFNAFHYTPYDSVKVVLLGQDPYHGAGQAHGLSFSVLPGVKIPPSLNNIFKELNADVGCSIPKDGNLTNWAKQGVLLLNSVLTVRGGEANSHQGKGWEQFTDKVISSLNLRVEPVIFLLWGSPAQKKRRLIDEKKHVVIASPHPSPLSAHRGFFGSKPFSKVNAILREWGQEPIHWQL